MAMYYDGKGSWEPKEQQEYLQAEFKKMGIKLNIVSMAKHQIKLLNVVLLVIMT